MIPLSILDLSPITEGSDAAQSFRNSLSLAQHGEKLGYTREELLSLGVTDVAVAPEASVIYADMLRARSQRGVTPIRTKDGRILTLEYNAAEVRVGRLPYWISIGLIQES